MNLSKWSTHQGEKMENKKRCLGQCKSLDLCRDFMEGDVEAGLIFVSHISQKNPLIFCEY